MLGLSRAGPSSSIFRQNVIRSSVIPISQSSQPQRCMAKVAKTVPVKSAKKKSQSKSYHGLVRDAEGNIIQPKKEKNVGAFRPWPVADLADPVFKSDQRSVLKLPTFNPAWPMVGKAAEFSLTDHDPVRIFGLPKKILLEFRILSKPCSVVRDITVEVTELLKKVRDKSSLDTRFVLTGRPGCGKSFLMLQAVESCISNGWIVLYIPRAVNLVNSTTPYEYDLRTRTYLQPAFTFQTLQRLRTVNLHALSGLTTQKKLVFEKREVPVGTNLVDLIGVALKDPASAPVIFEALMTELSNQTKHPVLLAVDDFQALYCQTAYRDPHFVPIRPYHLSVPRTIMEYASGRRSFAKGAFLGAITSSDTNYKTPLELKDALGVPHEHARSPYEKLSRSLVEYTKGLQALRVPEQLSVAEAASLFEIWMKDKALVPSTYDELFLSKYAESSGNARDFVWKGLLATLES